MSTHPSHAPETRAAKILGNAIAWVSVFGFFGFSMVLGKLIDSISL